LPAAFDLTCRKRPGFLELAASSGESFRWRWMIAFNPIDWSREFQTG